MRSPSAVVCGVGLLALSCAPVADPAGPVTLALVNARIWTGDPARSWVDALAIAQGRIVAIGTTDAIAELASGAEVIDLRRRLVLPGFIDAHTRLLDLAASTDLPSLAAVRSPGQLIDRIGSAVVDRVPGDWLIGREWDHRLWGGRLPHRDWIDPLTLEHPVWLKQRDRQMGLANTLALRRAGIVPGTPGAQLTYDRSSGQTLTGILTGTALQQLEAVLPEPSQRTLDRALEQAQREAAKRGVTSAHHLGAWGDLEVFMRARAAGRLTLRIYAAVPLDTWLRLDRSIGVNVFGGRNGHGDEWVRVGAVHARLDGSLVSGSAAFDAPYADHPAQRGEIEPGLETLRALALDADKAGFQLMTRATGDRAIRAALDLHRDITHAHGVRDRRFRIELPHHPAPADVARFATEGVLVSALPFSILHDGRWIDRQLGPDRARTSFPFRAWLDAGAGVSFGSGWLDRGSPIDGMYAAVTRRTFDGLHPDGFGPTQRLTAVEALQAYTTAAAYAGFGEASTGTLTVGRLADMVVVDRDLLTVPPNDISSVRVMLTVVGGRIVHDRLRP